jgi:hypothetical protein
MRFWVATLLTFGACEFTHGTLGGGPGGDGGVDRDGSQPTDGSGDPGAPFEPLHVPPGGAAPGTGDLELTAAVDTTALSIGGSTTMPAGVTFDSWPQASGPALAVLHVRSLSVPATATVRVTGSRAFVVVASGTISIAGTLNANGQRDVPGPGGSAPDAGAGKGNPGLHVQTFRDSGGSGAGFVTAGGTGGRVTGCMPTAGTVLAGTVYGDATITNLIGGSGGGTAYDGTCGNRTAGAGGGAIQLSSATSIVVSGGINVGGGGGGGGRSPITSSCNMTAGSGGGSGGALVLQAPVVGVPGTIAANGGAGGSSAGDVEGDNNYPSAHGEDGADGLLAASAAAPGADVGVWSSAGGAGGAGATGPGDGLENNDCDGNGGGGGGSVGRIVIAIPATGTITIGGTASPAHVPITY